MARRSDTPPRPLDAAELERLALHYVARYATSCSKLTFYLNRKLKERGWAEEEPARVDEVVERVAELGYIDDAAFARSRAETLTRRGYGVRRVAAALSGAGIVGEARATALDIASDGRMESALAFARRRRLGPFGMGAHDPKERQRQVAAFARAGHDLGTAQHIVHARTTDAIELEAD